MWLEILLVINHVASIITIHPRAVSAKRRDDVTLSEFLYDALVIFCIAYTVFNLGGTFIFWCVRKLKGH